MLAAVVAAAAVLGGSVCPYGIAWNANHGYSYCAGYEDGSVVITDPTNFNATELCAPATADFPCCDYYGFKSGNWTYGHWCFADETALNAPTHSSIPELKCTGQIHQVGPIGRRSHTVLNCAAGFNEALKVTPPLTADTQCPGGTFISEDYSSCNEAVEAIVNQTSMANITEEQLCAPASAEFPCCNFAGIKPSSLTLGLFTHRCYRPGEVHDGHVLPENGCPSILTYDHLGDANVYLLNCTDAPALPASPAPPPPPPTEEPAPVTPAPPAEDSGLSAGAIAGIAVGAVLAVVAAGVVLL